MNPMAAASYPESMARSGTATTAIPIERANAKATPRASGRSFLAGVSVTAGG